MSGIRLEDVTKRYPNGVRAVDDVSLDIADGEFMVLVGPSGCGKTTLLRSIAGLEDVTAGTIWIGDTDVTEKTPQQRDIAMVFQNYALYPHMSVADNLAYGLKLRRMDKGERDRKVRDIAGKLGLDELLDRKPSALSGGQRQRVAMGRAIVREPKAFLMDEPLSNLDAKLRVSMRAELARLHERLGVTTVYVTHDQVEAMTLGERVAVMRDGILQQVDTPQNLFNRPRNLFVAAFIGSPAMNLVEAKIDGGRVHFAGIDLPLPGGSPLAGEQRRVILGLRPNDFEHGAAADPDVAAHPRPARRGRAARLRDASHLRDRRPAGDGRRGEGRVRGLHRRRRQAVRRRGARDVHGELGRQAADRRRRARARGRLHGAALLRPGVRRRAGRPALGAARGLMEHLSAGGVSVVIDDRGQVVHWGAALPDDPSTLAAALTPPLPRASFDVPVPLTLTPIPSRRLARPPRPPRGVRPLCSSTVCDL